MPREPHLRVRRPQSSSKMSTIFLIVHAVAKIPVHLIVISTGIHSFLWIICIAAGVPASLRSFNFVERASSGVRLSMITVFRERCTGARCNVLHLTVISRPHANIVQSRLNVSQHIDKQQTVFFYKKSMEAKSQEDSGKKA